MIVLLVVVVVALLLAVQSSTGERLLLQRIAMLTGGIVSIEEPSGEIRGALVRNVSEGRFAYGASTISMQLAKNVFLAREKTLVRKLQEVALTWWLERSLAGEIRRHGERHPAQNAA